MLRVLNSPSTSVKDAIFIDFYDHTTHTTQARYYFVGLCLRLDEHLHVIFISLQFCETISISHRLRLFNNYARSAMNILNTGTLRTNDEPNTKNTIQIGLRQKNVVARAEAGIKGFRESID